MKNFSIFRTALVLSAAGTMASMALSQSAVLASSGHKAKAPHLSQSSINVQYLASDDVSSYVVALDRGFWKQRGLTVSFTDTTGGTSANNIAGLIGGSWQAAIVSPQSLIAANAANPQVRSLMATNAGGNDELTINQSFATAHNIPASANTAAGAVAQLNALKGSHLKLAFSTLTSTSFDDLLTVFQRYGISFSINGSNPNADVICNSVGTSGALDAAVTSGKDDSLINNPPVSVLPSTIVISIRKLLPVSHISSFNLDATTAFIKAHPDTVQALVTGAVEGMQYTKHHPAEAQRDMVAPLAKAGTTSPETVDYITAADLQDRSPSPLISRQSFAADLATASAASPTPYQVTYNNFVDNRFVQIAMKQLHFVPGKD